MRSNHLSVVVVRVLLGALFLVSGINKLVPFMPVPPMPDAAISFVVALQQTGYFLPLLAIVEIVAGALLITGQFVPLVLVVLAPIVVHIAFFHVLLAPSLATTVMVVGAELFLAWKYRSAFTALVQRTHTQATGEQRLARRESLGEMAAEGR